MIMKLFTYFRSTASYRVRIVLNLKQIDCEHVPVHLVRDGGEHLRAEYLQINPQGFVPALEDAGTILTQSQAIVEYLDEKFPVPALLPADPVQRAQVRALAGIIACDIHPLNNVRVLKYLRRELNCDDDAVNGWYRHWVTEGFRACESLICKTSNGRYCFGNSVTLADVFLAPQVFNARRFDCDLTPYPTIVSIEEHLLTLPAFADAAPEKQSDAS